MAGPYVPADHVPAYVKPPITWDMADASEANSSDAYTPKTLAEKAIAMTPDGVFATVLSTTPTTPYPVGSPPNAAARTAMLQRVHTPPLELAQGVDWNKQGAANLLAGGRTDGGALAAGVATNL